LLWNKIAIAIFIVCEAIGGILVNMNLAIAPEIPYLRRYARAITGSQSLGDAAVRETLEAIIKDHSQFDMEKPTRSELYRLFSKIWSEKTYSFSNDTNNSESLVQNLPPRNRQSLLLVSMEGFSINEVSEILNVDVDTVKDDLEEARESIRTGLKSNVMIIEDESIIALHIKSIVQELGHNICGIARTRDEAVKMATETNPDLVLADISLADGSSGIDAVKDILEQIDVPVIFITAFPERLLTGERPEPTYLITKPFEAETVVATIGQGLLYHHELRVRSKEAA
jgi:DNA-directed RNA polymerase specialized sigma24 family protein